MASLRIQFSQLGFLQKLHFSRTQLNLSMRKQKTSCSLRNGPRKPMWRSRVLSTEAIQAVQSLKLAKSPEKMEEVLKIKLSRLLKADVLDTLTELQRQNEVHLALQVFNFVRNEEWYVPDLSVFNSMIMMLGKNKLIGMAEQLFVDMTKEGLQLDSRTYTEFIGAYFRVDLVEKAMEMYELMKKSGFLPDKLTMSILIRSLQKAQEKELVARVKKECADYIDYPEKFLKEIESTNDRCTGLKIGTGRESESLYYLNSLNPSTSCLVTDHADLIHRRLGHLSLSKLQKMVPSLSTLECESCQLGKHIRASFPCSVENNVEYVFSLVHFDIWGPSKVSSTLRFCYFVSFIDDYSRCTWLFLIKDRLELFFIFQNFCAKIKNQFGVSLSALFAMIMP